jgi:hypothetical protein
VKAAEILRALLDAQKRAIAELGVGVSIVVSSATPEVMEAASEVAGAPAATVENSGMEWDRVRLAGQVLDRFDIDGPHRRSDDWRARAEAAERRLAELERETKVAS